VKQLFSLYIYLNYNCINKIKLKIATNSVQAYLVIFTNNNIGKII
jgi:hypothetical protein